MVCTTTTTIIHLSVGKKLINTTLIRVYNRSFDAFRPIAYERQFVEGVFILPEYLFPRAA